MTLQKCKECGQNVSTKANACPHCGAPQSSLMVIVIITLLVGGLIGFSIWYASYIFKIFPMAVHNKQQKADLIKPVKKEDPEVKNNIFKLDKTFIENSKFLLFDGSTIELKNGKYESKDKGNYLLVNIEKVIFGDLNGDGIEDAAVILGESGGGSGYFYYLYTVLNENKKIEVISGPAEIGDRIIIKSVTIQNGEIIIYKLTQGPNEPKASPTLNKTEKYKFVESKIVKVRPPSQVVDTAIVALKKLQAKTEVGIVYNNYLSAIGDTKYQVNLYLKSREYIEHLTLNKEIPKHIIKAMNYYELAKVVWEYKFQPIYERGLKGDEEKIFKEFGVIDYNSPLGELIRKNYPKAKLYGSNYRVDMVCSGLWHEAVIEIETATLLLE